MSLPATDDFNRANGALGSNWTGSVGGDLTIESNTVTGATSGSDNSMYWSADLPDAAQYVQCVLTDIAAGYYAAPVCRASATDWVALIAIGGLSWDIEWYNGGAWTVIGSAYNTPPANGDIGKITADGSTFKGYVNGTERISGSSASAPSGGYGGLYVYSTTANVDNFEVGNLGGASPSHTFGTSGEFPTDTGVSTANPVSTTFTCPSGTTVLALMLWYAGSTDRTGGAPTYNSAAMTLADGPRRASASPETTIEVWYMLDPPTGSAYTLSVPNSNTRSCKLWMATFAASSGYTSALDVTNWGQNTSANPSISITTTANGCAIVGLIGNGANTWAPTGRSGVQLYDRDLGNYGGGCQYFLQSAAGAQTVSWTFGTGDDWAIIAVAFKPQLSGVTVAPGAATGAAASITPTVVLGSVAIAPAPGAGAAASIAPTVVVGSITVTPNPAAGAALSVNPTPILGSVAVIPAPATAPIAAINPAAVLGSTTASPAPAAVAAAVAAAGVILGSVTITPVAAAGTAQSVNPAVLAGGMVINPAPAASAAASVTPAVILGSVTAAPGAAAAVALSVAPTTIGGGTIISPSPAAAAAAVGAATIILGSVTVVAGAASAPAATVSPAVIFGNITVTPALASAIATAGSPAVVLGSVTAAPGAADAAALSIAPTVILSSIAVTPSPSVVAGSALIGNVLVVVPDTAGLALASVTLLHDAAAGVMTLNDASSVELAYHAAVGEAVHG